MVKTVTIAPEHCVTIDLILYVENMIKFLSITITLIDSQWM